MPRSLTPLAAIALALLAAGQACAQNGGGQKPFEGIYRRPALSPYQQLSNFGNNPQAAPNIYQQMVQPLQQQQEQQIQAMSQGRQINRLQNQVQQIQRGTTARQVDETIRPTGHASTFQNLSHFYPSAR
jgi:hypothetical protein